MSPLPLAWLTEPDPLVSSAAALASAWAGTEAGAEAWYTEALHAWRARVARSPATARSYLRTVGGFFAWCEASGRPTAPHQIKASDVDAWIAWQNDGGRLVPSTLSPPAAGLLRVVGEGAATLRQITQRVRQTGFSQMTDEQARTLLGALVGQKAIVASPVQHGDPKAATSAAAAERTYALSLARGALAAATIAQRLSALHSFFLACVGEGGRQAGTAARGPMRVTPTRAALQRYGELAASEKRTTSEGRRTRAVDWEEIRRACWTQEASDRKKQRDWTILLTLVTTGLRVSELCALRGSDVERDGEARHAVVRRKGGSLDRLRIPQVAWAEIETLHGGVVPASLPLVALAVHRWGNQANIPIEEPISTSRVQEIFFDLAASIAAETGASAAEAARLHARLHPHGLRHLYANQLAASGVSMHAIRNLLHHQSLATTDTYLSRAEGKDEDHSAVFATFASRS